MNGSPSTAPTGRQSAAAQVQHQLMRRRANTLAGVNTSSFSMRAKNMYRGSLTGFERFTPSLKRARCTTGISSTTKHKTPSFLFWLNNYAATRRPPRQKLKKTYFSYMLYFKEQKSQLVLKSFSNFFVKSEITLDFKECMCYNIDRLDRPT